MSLLVPTELASELFDCFIASSLMLWLLTTSVSALTLFSTDVFCCFNAALVHWLIQLLVDVVVDMVLSKTNKRRTQVQESKQARKKKKLIFFRIYITIYGKQREFIKKKNVVLECTDEVNNLCYVAYIGCVTNKKAY